jgi:hypothetical protein
MGEVELKLGWQPIETAPKGRRARFLVFADRVYVGNRYSSFAGRGFDVLCPTHWMPLPEPPAKP